MADTETNLAQPSAPAEPLPWRGLLAFALLAVVGSMGTDIAPSSYFPDLDWYIPRYILLAISVGLAFSAVRSRERLERLLGLADLVVGLAMVGYIIRECLRITGS